MGTVETMFFLGDTLRATGTLDPGHPSLTARMTSGELRPQMQMHGGTYILRGEQVQFTSGVVHAVLLGSEPAFPQARFDTVREVTH